MSKLFRSYMYAFNPELKQRMLYVRDGDSHVLRCLVGTHHFTFDFKAKALEEINALENTIKECNKEIERIRKRERVGEQK